MSRQPIDHGWSWMICLGTAVQAFFVIGGLKSMGVLFVEISEMFDAPKALIAVTLGLVAGGFAVFAMMSNALAVLFGIRQVVFAGDILFILSVGLSSAGVSVWYLIFTLGLLSGLAFGAMLPPAILLTTLYFDKRKSFANGLAMAGSSVGQLCMPYLVTYLLDEYGYHGAMLIYTGLSLHTIPAMMLLRPLTFWDKGSKKKEKTQNEEQKLYSLAEKEDNNRSLENNIDMDMHVSHPVLHNLKKESLHRSLPLLREDSGTKLEAKSSVDVVISTTVSNPSLQASRHSLHRKQSALQASALSLVPGLSVEHLAAYEKEQKSATDESELPRKYRCGRIWMKKMSCAEFRSLMFDPELVHSPTLWVLFVALGSGHAGFMNSLLHIPALSVELFNDRYKGALLVAFIGLLDIAGRLGGGWFADLGLINRVKLTAIAFTAVGSSTIIVMLYPRLWFLFVYAVIMGLIGGLYRILLPIIVGDVFGKDKIGPGMGMLFMSLGVFIVPIPPLLGYMQQVFLSYIPAFHLCGAFLLAGAVLLFIAPCIQKYDKAVINSDEATDITSQNGKSCAGPGPMDGYNDCPEKDTEETENV